MPATEGTWQFTARRTPLALWIDRTVMASIGAMLAIGFFLFARRASGAMTTSLPTGPLIITASGLTAWVIFLRAIWRPQSGVVRRLCQLHLHLALPLVAMLSFAVACSYPGRRAIDWLVWPVAFLIVAFSQKLIEQLRAYVQPPTPKMIETEPESLPLQQLTRYRDANGMQSIHGTLCAEFALGERSTTLHVAFCPPFERLPSLEFETVDDSEADVKLTQLLHHGAQFEIRLPDPADEAQIARLEFVATETPPT